MTGSIIVATCRAFAEDFPGQRDHIADSLSRRGIGVDVHHCVDGRFPDGELRVDLPEPGRGRPVLIAQSLTGPGQDPDAALMALLATARAYQDHGAGPVCGFVPHLAYARHDRLIPSQRRPLFVRLLADLANAAGLGHLIAIASGAEERLRALFHSPKLSLISALPLHRHLLERLGTPATCLVAPDKGAYSPVRQLGEALGLPTVALAKDRLGPDQVRAIVPRTATVPAGGHAVVVDDLVTSAGTLEATVAALRSRAPALRISAVATHLRPTATGLRRLDQLFQSGALAGLHVTDSAGHRTGARGLTVVGALPVVADHVAAAFMTESSRLRRAHASNL
ncbi:ribose-phosphate pyrophosphokinase-like domain-containing protein [Micromonospora tulbaghiae]|uniref:ribose-phosphate pyrophosphokinase-like domain-containing protein n=1 Tax=Micromonospora tulbaghiae TaxID=479978 RepID=UPI0033EE3A8E